MLGSIDDVWAYSTLGMFADRFEDEVNSLYKKSLVYPVSREDVENLLAKYNVRYAELPSWLHARVGEIEVAD
jgi:hypothetical protein